MPACSRSPPAMFSSPTRCATRWGEPTKQPSWLARRGVVTVRPNSFSLLHWEALPGGGQEKHSKHMMRRKQIEWKKRARRPPRTGDPHRERNQKGTTVRMWRQSACRPIASAKASGIPKRVIETEGEVDAAALRARRSVQESRQCARRARESGRIGGDRVGGDGSASRTSTHW